MLFYAWTVSMDTHDCDLRGKIYHYVCEQIFDMSRAFLNVSLKKCGR